MKKTFLLLSFLTSLTSNVSASSKSCIHEKTTNIKPTSKDIYQQKISPEVNIQIKKLLEEIEDLVLTLQEDEEKRNIFLERLSDQQLELINKIGKEGGKENVIKLIQNYGAPTTPVVHEIEATTCSNTPKNTKTGKIFQIFTNLTSPKAIMSTAAVIVTLAVKGIITSGELTRIFHELATIAKWQTLGGLTSNFLHFLTYLPYLLKAYKPW